MSFYDGCARFVEKTAFLDDRGQSITYGELDHWAEAFGKQMEPRRLAFCLCENSVGSAMGYLACLRRRVVPLMLDRKIDEELLSHLLEVYGPEYLYFPEELQSRFPDCTPISGGFGYVLAKTSAPLTQPLHPDLALLLTTSGSTGSPKLVRQSYENIQANAEAIAEYLELDDTERPIATLPMNYTYGLSIINSHVQVGATILLTDKTMMMKAFWDFFQAQQATSFGGVPFTYEMLKRVRFTRMDLPSLRYITQAGGKLPPELHREFAQWALDMGKKFVVMYGQTEATARMGYLPADMALEKCGSMGKVIPGGTFKLIDAQDQLITQPDVVGELIYEGPNVTMGYAEGRADLAKGDERGGVLKTGDMAKVDQDGFYYIVGRKKRFLKIFGNRVNLDEIDRLIKSKFEDVDCASTGVDDKMKTYITREDLIVPVRQYLSNTTHLSESAFQVVYIPEIPKNDAGKTLYKDLPL